MEPISQSDPYVGDLGRGHVCIYRLVMVFSFIDFEAVIEVFYEYSS